MARQRAVGTVGGSVLVMTARRLLLLVLALGVLSACFATGEDEGLPAAAPGAVRVAAVGDSITAADSADFAAGELGRESWVWHAAGEDIAFVGGWAVWGATTEQMADGVAPVDADVLVVLAGTNDSGVPFVETAEHVRSVVATVDVAAVVLSAVPPIDADPARAVVLNERLEELAAQEGWHWSPQPPGLAEGDRFAPGMSADGLHPTREGAALLGEQIATAVRAAAD